MKVYDRKEDLFTNYPAVKHTKRSNIAITCEKTGGPLLLYDTSVDVSSAKILPT